jgi:uncharacterized membrane protein YcaP (DUF421 family)
VNYTVLGAPLLQIMLRTMAVYVVVLAGFRIAGKREIGQFTVFDLTLILLISNAVQNAMVGADTTLFGGLVAAITLLVTNYLVSLASARIPWLQRVTVGTPSILINNGQIITAHLQREGVTVDELEAALREHGVASAAHVQTAVLEVDGSISVVLMGTDVVRTAKIVTPRHRARFVRRRQ